MAGLEKFLIPELGAEQIIIIDDAAFYKLKRIKELGSVDILFNPYDDACKMHESQAG
jgi:hypothetical protein